MALRHEFNEVEDSLVLGPTLPTAQNGRTRHAPKHPSHANAWLGVVLAVRRAGRIGHHIALVTTASSFATAALAPRPGARRRAMHPLLLRLTAAVFLTA